MSQPWIARVPEPQAMDDVAEVRAYDEADFTEVNRELARRIIRLAGRAGRAIDLGTGPASIPLELCRLAPGWRVLGIDISRRMLARAREHIRAAGLARNIRLHHADGGRLDGSVRGFDLALSNSLLHHLPEPIGFWRVLHELVRPGGTIVVQDLLRPASAAAARRLVEKHAREDSALLRELFHRSLLAAYTPGEVEEQLHLAGVRGLRVRKVSDRHVLISGKRLDNS